VEQIVAVDEGRFDLWQAAIQQWKLEPWTGTGSGTYRFYGRLFRSDKMQQDPVAVHNDYLHFLSEYGVFGGVAFLLFFGIHVYRGLRSFARLGPQRLATGEPALSDRFALNLGALCAVAAFTVHSAVDFNMHIPANALLLAFVFGILANSGLDFATVKAQSARRSCRESRRFRRDIAARDVRASAPGEYYANRARGPWKPKTRTLPFPSRQQALEYDESNPRIFFYLGRALSAIGEDKIRTEHRHAHYEAALAALRPGPLAKPLDGSHPLDMAELYGGWVASPEADDVHASRRERDPRAVHLNERYRLHLQRMENTARETTTAFTWQVRSILRAYQ
jgi:hypothetical protein